MITVGPGFSMTAGAANQVPPGLEAAMDAAATSALIELFAGYRVTVERSVGLQAPLAALGVVRFTAPGMTGTATLGVSAATSESRSRAAMAMRNGSGGASSAMPKALPLMFPSGWAKRRAGRQSCRQSYPSCDRKLRHMHLSR